MSSKLTIGGSSIESFVSSQLSRRATAQPQASTPAPAGTAEEVVAGPSSAALPTPLRPAAPAFWDSYFENPEKLNAHADVPHFDTRILLGNASKPGFMDKVPTPFCFASFSGEEVQSFVEIQEDTLWGVAGEGEEAELEPTGSRMGFSYDKATTRKATLADGTTQNYNFPQNHLKKKFGLDFDANFSTRGDVNLPPEQRSALNIHERARYYHFVYPSNAFGAEGIKNAAEARGITVEHFFGEVASELNKKFGSDFASLLIIGGFVYLDENNKVVQIKSIVPRAASDTLSLMRAKEASKIPSGLWSDFTRGIRVFNESGGGKNGFCNPITAPELNALGAQFFAWIPQDALPEDLLKEREALEAAQKDPTYLRLKTLKENESKNVDEANKKHMLIFMLENQGRTPDVGFDGQYTQNHYFEGNWASYTQLSDILKPEYTQIMERLPQGERAKKIADLKRELEALKNTIAQNKREIEQISRTNPGLLARVEQLKLALNDKMIPYQKFKEHAPFGAFIYSFNDPSLNCFLPVGADAVKEQSDETKRKIRISDPSRPGQTKEVSAFVDEDCMMCGETPNIAYETTDNAYHVVCCADCNQGVTPLQRNQLIPGKIVKSFTPLELSLNAGNRGQFDLYQVLHVEPISRFQEVKIAEMASSKKYPVNVPNKPAANIPPSATSFSFLYPSEKLVQKENLAEINNLYSYGGYAYFDQQGSLVGINHLPFERTEKTKDLSFSPLEEVQVSHETLKHLKEVMKKKNGGLPFVTIKALRQKGMPHFMWVPPKDPVFTSEHGCFIYTNTDGTKIFKKMVTSGGASANAQGAFF